ncbi:MAG TPA: GNAT family N-acetyltransferase [Devosia sp.]|nr:GNAT family N-acetyltransferase [Devosia sp.]
MQAPVLTTERLVLRGQRLDDFDRLAALYTTERSRYIGGPLPPPDVWRGFMNSVGHWAVRNYGGWAIDLAATGENIGEVAVTHPVSFPETELGWLLFDGFEGQGYATEAAHAALRYAKDTAQPPTLVSYIDPENASSLRLAHRLGAQRDLAAATPNGDPCLVLRYW